jgi:hypothetical protein
MLTRLAGAGRRVPVRRVLTGALGVSVLLGILGAVQVALGGATSAPKSALLHQIDLDSELNVPSAWSALLLAAAAAACALRVILRSHLRAAWVGLALLFAFMALDELVQFHERVELALGGDWQIAYLPVIAGAGLAWATVVRWGRNTDVRLGLLVGAALWAGAQFFEAMWQAEIMYSTWWSVPEELFEMLGDICFLGAALASLRPARRVGARLRWTAAREGVLRERSLDARRAARARERRSAA